MNRKLTRYAILITLESIFIAFLIALTGWLLSEGILFFVLNMTHTEMELTLRLLIDGGVALVAFIVTFFLVRKGKAARAKIIDTQLDLKEKVATMVEFENDPSEMARIQRADAMKTISEKPKKRFRLKFKPLPLILALVAFVACAITHFIPYPEAVVEAEEELEEEVTDPEEDEENVQDNNIQDIIDKVENNDKIPSDIQKEIKDDLEELDRNLRDDETNEERDQDIQDTIDKLEQQKQEAVSHDKIGQALQKHESTKELGEAISSGDAEKVQEALDNMLESFEKIEDEKERDEAKKEVAKDISDALDESGVSEEDSLHQALSDFAENLQKPSDQQQGDQQQGDKPQGDKQLQGAFDQAKEDINEALDQQKQIEDAFNQAMEDLKNMMDGQNQRPDNPPDNPNPNPNQGNGAGVGSGETNYGADEVLYDPETNTEIKYGELLSYYYGLINATITEAEVPENLEKMIYTYFGYLFYSEKPTEGANS